LVIASNKESVTGWLWFFYDLLLLYIYVACITKTFYKRTIWVDIFSWKFRLLCLYSFICFSKCWCYHFLLYFVHYIAVYLYHTSWRELRTIDIFQKTARHTKLLGNFILIEDKLRMRPHCGIFELNVYLWL
jgi:hypothetical protein